MARTPIRTVTFDLLGDNGTVAVSVPHGDQRRLRVRVKSLDSLSGYAIAAKCVEAQNVVGDLQDVPFQIKPSGVITPLPIINRDDAAKLFDIVFPYNLAASYDPKPGPDDPVFGYYSCRITDTGQGDAKQSFTVARGLVKVWFNPVELS